MYLLGIGGHLSDHAFDHSNIVIVTQVNEHWFALNFGLLSAFFINVLHVCVSILRADPDSRSSVQSSQTSWDSFNNKTGIKSCSVLVALDFVQLCNSCGVLWQVKSWKHLLQNKTSQLSSWLHCGYIYFDKVSFHINLTRKFVLKSCFFSLYWNHYIMLKTEIECFKGIVHPKMKILSSFTHPQVVPNLYEFQCSAEHKGRYSEESL